MRCDRIVDFLLISSVAVSRSALTMESLEFIRLAKGRREGESDSVLSSFRRFGQFVPQLIARRKLLPL